MLLGNIKELKQLDRIEYMLRLKRIEDKFSSGAFFYVSMIFLAFAFFSLIFMVVIYSAFGIETLSSVYSKIKLGYLFLGILIGISFIVDMLILFFNIKYKQELFKDYFEVKLKNDKR